MTTAGRGPRRVLVVWCPAWPGRDVAEAKSGSDAPAFEQVVTVVEGFCPRVEVLYPGTCAVAARGPARYFGGEEALAGKIIEAVARRGFACQVGVADGLFAAQLAARAVQLAVVAPGETPAFLAPHPVSSLGNPDLADLLPRLGIRTLGEFAALSPAEAENRFGAQGALAHRLARGLDPRPLAPRPPSVDLSVCVEFDPPADQSEPVVFAAKALAERMHAGLAARGLACVRVQVQAFCEDGQEITRLWRHDGLLSALAVAERARWQLAGWRTARAVEGAAGDGIEAGGITLLRLIPDQLVRDEGRQLGLWGDAVVSDRVARAAVRVQAMLGHGAVTRPVLAGGRSPADQVTLVPFGDAVDPRYPVGQPWPGRLPAPAPATICPVPVPVTVTDDSGGPVTVTGRAMVSAPPAQLPGAQLPGPRLSAAQLEAAQVEAARIEAARRTVDGGPWLAITSWAGPWPVDERWWRPADACRKARFQLVTGDGSAWLATVQDGRWLIEAGYDLPAASGAGRPTPSAPTSTPDNRRGVVPGSRPRHPLVLSQPGRRGQKFMGWDNSPLPWREFERRLSWGKPAREPAGRGRADAEARDQLRRLRLVAARDEARHDEFRPGKPRHGKPRHGKPRRASRDTAWAELHCHSSYSFLDGASSPEDLVAEAAGHGLEALAITDHDGMYGVPQFAQAAARLKRAGIRLGTVFGAELSLELPGGQGGVPDPVGRHLLVLARDPEGYRRLCQVISAAQLRGGEKGRPVYDQGELAQAHDGHWVILTGCRKGAVPAALTTAGPVPAGPGAAARELRALIDMYGRQNVVVELTTHDQPTDDERNDALYELARQAGTAVIATNNVHYASPADAKLAQALAAIRSRRSLDDMDGWLAASGAAYLRSGEEMAHRLRRYPGVREAAVELAAECAFDFHVIAPKLPDFPVPEGHTEATWLRHLVAVRAPERYGPPQAERVEGAYAQIASELRVIVDLGFPGYFLIVHDIVRFCERNGILCQGRGSAANSAVCYALGITSVDPVRHGLLFERFLSAGRDGPPDIDLDIEHQRREEVIQYVYDSYGRQNAAQVANVISYRPRMALRDAGRALGYEPGTLDAWAKQVGPRPYGPGQLIPPDAGVPPAVTALAARMQRLPRHLGIHSGGMVICDRPAGEVCPVEWARMPGRTVLQWDKDDCAYAGLVKFDLLGLGMLTALRDCFELVEAHHGQRWNLHSIPQEDPGVYDMLCEADTVGVFQVESRAQMATLPRLRPREFYDLVVEVALIRPGPIQGGSVHPYMRRRHGDELADLPHESMRVALGKTLGVPLFQEQMMQLAIDCASFTPAEADRLRQAMSSKRAPERIEELRERLLGGMAANGIPADVAEDIYVKILAFSSYGFPESHAISFAYLVYASAWLKCYYPAAFTAALLRAQPMGFYSPASLISDVRRHGVPVRGVDVNASAVLATLENPAFTIRNGSQPVAGQPAIRLGLADVRNLGADPAAAIVAGQPYRDLEDFARRTRLPAPALEALATAGAFGSLGIGRREALWAAGAAATIRAGQLPGTTPGLAAPPLPAMTAAEETFADLWATGTYGTHPIEHIRPGLAEQGVIGASDLRTARPGANVAVAGLVTHRQQPGTARGVVFLSLEDETGMANVICPPAVWERHRRLAMDASALVVMGRVERLDGAVSLLASRLRRLRVVAAARSRDFR